MEKLKGWSLLSIKDLNFDELKKFLELVIELKFGKKNIKCNKVLGFLFFKVFIRIRVSFIVVMY